MTKNPGKLNLVFLLFITLVSAMGGLLFGYDWVVIGGAKPFYEAFFGITQDPSIQGWTMSSAIVGCLVGASVAGMVSDRFGRKKPLIFSAFLFTLSAIGTGAVNSLDPFIIFRMVGGFGIGMASVLSPIYIAEISPAHLRGRFVSINQLTIVLGILLAQLINLIIAKDVPEGASTQMILESWNGQTGWRWMFWAETIFSISFFIMMFFIPESPRWLYKAGKKDLAFNIFTRVGGENYALAEQKEITINIGNQSTSRTSLKDLKPRKYRKIIFIGVVLAVLQQLCGVNVIFNYAQEIFSDSGYGISSMLVNVVVSGLVNVIATILAMRLIDRIGRRFLMVNGYLVLFIVFVIFGTLFYFDLKGLAMLICVYLGIAFYAVTLAPTTWVVLSEIFPNKIRGVAMSIATFFLWLACLILTYTFPIIRDTLSTSGTFWIYAGMCLIGYLFTKKYLPETKGKTLEEIEDEF